MIFKREFLEGNVRYPSFIEMKGYQVHSLYESLESDEYRELTNSVASWEELWEVGESKFYEEKAMLEFNKDLKDLIK